MKKVLVVSAHPDDEVLGMGGTIAKLCSLGCEVNLLIVTDGSTSQYRNSTNIDSIIENKKKETLQCANVLGIKSIMYGELPDMMLDAIPHVKINSVIEDAVRKVCPDVVFTHFWGDVNKDHQHVYSSTLVSVRPVYGQSVKELYCYRVPSSTEWMPSKPSTMFVPNTFVDISKYSKIKYEAFSKYSTELREYPHPRSVRYLLETDRAVGLQVGLTCAEEFILLRSIK